MDHEIEVEEVANEITSNIFNGLRQIDNSNRKKLKSQTLKVLAKVEKEIERIKKRTKRLKTS